MRREIYLEFFFFLRKFRTVSDLLFFVIAKLFNCDLMGDGHVNGLWASPASEFRNNIERPHTSGSVFVALPITSFLTFFSIVCCENDLWYATGRRHRYFRDDFAIVNKTFTCWRICCFRIVGAMLNASSVCWNTNEPTSTANFARNDKRH